MKQTKIFSLLNLAPALLILAISSPLLQGCAGLTKAHQENQADTEHPATAPIPPKPDWLTPLDSANAHILNLEAKIGTLNEKIDAQRSVLDNYISSQQAQTQGVRSRPQDSAGTAVTTRTANSDPMVGFSSDEATQRYRKAMILFQSKNYSEAILGFSSFVDRFPDHALAGSAQFFLAESYLAQHQPKLAAREYQRVLTTYDRSPHIADTLERVAECEDSLKQPQEAAKHREMLMTLFPASPAAARAKRAGLSTAIDETPVETKSEARPKIETESTPAAAEPQSAAPPTAAPAADGLDSPPPTAPTAPANSTGTAAAPEKATEQEFHPNQ